MTPGEPTAGHEATWPAGRPEGPVVDRERVRALLFDGRGSVVLFRRVIADHPVYWSLPGGGIEPGETRLEALRRELDEELRAVATRFTPLTSVVVRHEDGRLHRQHLFACLLRDMRPEERYGPEFHAGNGRHEVVHVPFTAEAIGGVDLRPAALRAWIVASVDELRALFPAADTAAPPTTQ
ncbi:hypothetical protein GCM10027294_30630 [Marinactinospora endophytica]